MFFLYTEEIFFILRNKLCGYADDSTLIAVIPYRDGKVAVMESLNRDINRVSMWCDLWGTKLNANMTKTMIVSRSSTIHPQSIPLTLDGTLLEESADLVISGVTFDSRPDDLFRSIFALTPEL